MVRDSIIPYSIAQSLSALENIYEVRLFGWVIAKAQSVLKLRQQELQEVNIEHALGVTRVTFPARFLLPEGDTNYKNIPKAFTLADKRITYEKNDTYYHLHIIAFPEFRYVGREKMVTFLIHNEIWHALLDFTRGYRNISLPVMMNLRSVYSCVMYVLCSNQSKPLTFTIEKMREYCGCLDKKAYERTANFIAKVIEPARLDLDAHSPFSFDYTLQRAGIGGGYKKIVVIPRRNKMSAPPPQDPTRDAAIESQRLRLDDRVVEYLQSAFYLQTKEIEQIEELVLALGDWSRQVRRLADIATAARRQRVQNLGGYLYTALCRN